MDTLPTETVVALALGSNMGDRAAMLRKACLALSFVLRVTKTSRVYETAAAYITDQPAFLNAAIMATTPLIPQDLLYAIKSIETELGRIKTVRYGPRAIDIDILYYGNKMISDDVLQIPHPRMAERAFVLYPLADIAPNWVHPKTQQSVIEMLNSQRDPSVRIMDDILEISP
jgi:2-amino-4-hydroxy-6-hydroxymethyldihydropteridine diphosphokinase